MCHAEVLSRRWSAHRFGLLGMAAAIVVVTGGCRTNSWTAPSSWSMFSSQPKNADTLAAGAAVPGDITKPSATAQPYPTTSTPQAYSLAGGATAPAAGGVSRAGTPRTNELGPVVYGSTPPASVTAPPALAAAPTAGGSPPAGPPLSTIAPQVGPYAASGALPGNASPGNAAPTSGFAAAAPPPVATSPELTPSSAPPPERLAENQPSFSAPPGGSSPAAPSWGGASADALAGGSRYATGGSRFSSPPSDAAAAASAWPAPPPAQTTPGADPSTGFQPLLTPPPATEAQLPTEVPAGQAPAAQLPAFQPPPVAAPAAPPPAAPPARRPDPGYRPGGTSSYRPGADILNDRAVQPVSFGAPAPPPAASPASPHTP